MSRAATMLVLGIIAAGLLACRGDVDDEGFDAGSVEDFPPGSVTTILYGEGRELGRGADGASPGVQDRPEDSIVFHLVHLEDGEFRALSAKDPHLGCTVPWRPEFQFEGQTGWFRNPCHGETYDITGRRVFGPSPRDLDRYPVEVRDGRVIVTLSEDALILGEPGVSSAPGATPTRIAPPQPTELATITVPPFDGHTQDLEHVRQRADFPVFAPIDVPEGLTGRIVDRIQFAETSVHIDYVDAEDRVRFIVVSCPVRCAPFSGGEVVTLSEGRTAHLVATTFSEDDQTATGQALWWEQDGAYLIVASTELGADDLTRIASSVTDAAPLNPASISANWRDQLREVPALIPIVEQVTEGPTDILSLLRAVPASCSFHGELLSPCVERGLNLSDHFDAVGVSDLLHCEACAVPPERLEGALDQIFERGGVSIEAFWNSAVEAQTGVQSDAGIELVGAWVLDERTATVIAERWSGLSASHALAFRSVQAVAASDVATGFVVFVDPAAERAIAVVEPTTEGWTAFDTADRLGAWEVLYATR